MPALQRPPILQPMTPHVEFYIRGKDILRSESDKKPKRLVSFSFDMSSLGIGTFQLELFDPDYVAVEELLLGLFLEGVGETQTEGEAGVTTTTSTDNVTDLYHVRFRFGYIGPDGQKYLISSPSGEGYCVGMIQSYVPSYQVNGIRLTIVGCVSAFETEKFVKKHRVDSSFFDKPVYDIIKDVCTLQQWEFRGLGKEEILSELPPEKQPEAQLSTSEAIDSTEASSRTIRVYEYETAYDFVRRICQYVRPVNPKYGNFSCHLATYSNSADSNSKPTTYLYFGPEDPTQDPVRHYVYMHRRVTDVISFSPVVVGFVGAALGAQGFLAKVEDSLHGDPKVHVIDESNRYPKVFPEWREEVSSQHCLDAPPQESVFIEKPKNMSIQEGSTHGGHVLAPKKQIPPDFPLLELSFTPENDLYVDREAMAYWLASQSAVNTAVLEIVGDPSPELQASKLVDIFVFVPSGDNKFKLHFTSNRWYISAVSHRIQHGTYTTTLHLFKTGFTAGRTSSRAYRIQDVAASLRESLLGVIGEEGMRQIDTGDLGLGE